MFENSHIIHRYQASQGTELLRTNGLHVAERRPKFTHAKSVGFGALPSIDMHLGRSRCWYRGYPLLHPRLHGQARVLFGTLEFLRSGSPSALWPLGALRPGCLEAGPPAAVSSAANTSGATPKAARGKGQLSRHERNKVFLKAVEKHVCGHWNAGACDEAVGSEVPTPRRQPAGPSRSATPAWPARAHTALRSAPTCPPSVCSHRAVAYLMCASHFLCCCVFCRG